MIVQCRPSARKSTAKQGGWESVIVILIRGLVLTLLCYGGYVLSTIDGTLFECITDSGSSTRKLTVRPVQPRSVKEEALIPKLETTSVDKATATIKRSVWDISSWFTKAPPAEIVNGPKRHQSQQNLPSGPDSKDSASIPSQVTDVRQNANFVLSEGAKRERNPGSSSNSNGTAATALFGKLTKAECRAKYGERRYLPPDQKRHPPMLYTFPGSGNTWCRLLVEFGTGIYTGSVYNDQSLLHSLPGEFTCNSQVSVIKIHPHTHPFEGLRTGNFNSDANKCKRGGIDKLRRAVLLIRDPFDSIWSEFQRRTTQSHVTGIRKDEFGWQQWCVRAAQPNSGSVTLYSRANEFSMNLFASLSTF